MEKPNALVILLDALKDADTETSVRSENNGGALIYLPSNEQPIRLNREEAELVFHSVSTVEQLFKA